MLQRQQAGAVIAAREQIVEGAVTMVNQALKRLEADDLHSVNAQIEVLLHRALDDAGRGVKAAPMRGRCRPRKDGGEGGSKNGTAEPSDVVDPPADSE